MPPCDRAERPLPQNLSHCHPVRSSSFFHAELHTVEGQPFLPIPWGEMKENAILFLKVGVYGILDFLLAACGLLQWPSPRFRLCRGGAQVPGCRISRPVGAKGRVLAGAWRRGGGGVRAATWAATGSQEISPHWIWIPARTSGAPLRSWALGNPASPRERSGGVCMPLASTCSVCSV